MKIYTVQNSLLLQNWNVWNVEFSPQIFTAFRYALAIIGNHWSRRFYETMDWQKAWSIRDTYAWNIERASSVEKTATRTAPEVARFDAGACNFD